MNDFWLIMAIVVIAVFIPLAYLWWKRRIPRGWYLGPNIRGDNKSKGMLLATPGGTGWAHILGEPHYATKGCGPLDPRSQIRCRWRFSGIAWPVEDPNSPPLVSLHFQRKGDDWRARDGTEFYRWYSIATHTLAAGEHEMIVPLQPHFWIAVMGGHASLHRERFLEALKHADRVGLTFGWDAGRGHGVKGAGHIEVLEFVIEPIS